MKEMKMRHVFTSESVSEGHPDKVCDQIADAILDACLAQDPESRVACEVLVTTNLIVIAGEITSRAVVPYVEIARRVVAKIGYNDPSPEMGFAAETAKVLLSVHQQSSDISVGVTAQEEKGHEQGAGDQGMMFGYACDETSELMPAPIYYAHKIMHRLAELRHSDPEKYHNLLPDAKSQVSLFYDNGRPIAINNIVVSHQHTKEMDIKKLRKVVAAVIVEVMPKKWVKRMKEDAKTEENLFVNPTGVFIIGGPNGDSGVTGRKIIVDTYGGMGRHGGGAFSGKDPSKVDRSATYMARYAAKNIVAAGLASKCEIQVAYAIGVAKPLSVNVDTFGTAKNVTEEELEEILYDGKVFDFRPAAIVDALKLKTPQGWCYEDAAAYGHFGRPEFPWEKTDKVQALQDAVQAL